MNEEALSEETGRILRRVGRTLGAREGTRPDDTPWLRMERQESRAEGHAEGRAEGRAEGERALLVRLAARRFGTGTAQRLFALLLRIEDPDRLADVGEWIVDCTSGDELLARAAALDTRT